MTRPHQGLEFFRENTVAVEVKSVTSVVMYDKKRQYDYIEIYAKRQKY